MLIMLLFPLCHKGLEESRMSFYLLARWSMAVHSNALTAVERMVPYPMGTTVPVQSCRHGDSLGPLTPFLAIHCT
jgi:hypothetical protein